jgi:spectinomycin phosphotransferase
MLMMEDCSVMPDMTRILKQEYHIIPVDIQPQFGGLSALGYRIQTTDKDYFLKAYVKSKNATAKWTSLIGNYIPILLWLNQNTDLKNRIVDPIRTVTGEYQCEDDECIYLLFSFIHGHTIGNADLSTAQAIELAHIIGILHQNSSDTIPGSYGQMTEDFNLSFCKDMHFFMENNLCESTGEVKSIVTRYLPQLRDATEKAFQMSDILSNRKPALVFCHTDIHNYNIMQAERVFLIDWEGMKLAPPEHDIMFIYGNPYYEDFMQVYRYYHPGYKLDETVLDFYILRRKLEDIWAFIEEIICDTLQEADLNRNLHFLEKICASLTSNSRKFELS